MTRFSPASARSARALRDGAWGSRLSFSPKVFLPVTRLCRNRCSYCSFRRDPTGLDQHTMSPAQVVEALDAAVMAGCTEALLCLGDTPETGLPGYRALLASWGYASTVGYLEAIAHMALERGLLPHTNAGILSEAQLRRLRACNVSMGLMLESTSERLCGPGGPHARARDKRPAVRLAMLETAGRLRIPMTTGLLVGMGETAAERQDTIEAIARLHARHGHIQEVIVQPFRAGAGTPMAGAPEPEDAVISEAISLARTTLPVEVSVQTPPNLGRLAPAWGAGINDLGGISPVTPDFINPGHPWPELVALADEAATLGARLEARLPVYARFVETPGWLDPVLRPVVEAAAVQQRERWAWLGARGAA